MPHVLTTGGWDGMQWSRLATLPWQITVIDGSLINVAETGRAALQWVQGCDQRAGAGLPPVPVNRASTGPTIARMNT